MMALPRLTRIVLTVIAVLVALQVLGLVLLQAGGASPPERGRGSPVDLSRHR